jgi:hypothetical protein
VPRPRRDFAEVYPEILNLEIVARLKSLSSVLLDKVFYQVDKKQLRIPPAQFATKLRIGRLCAPPGTGPGGRATYAVRRVCARGFVQSVAGPVALARGATRPSPR